MKQKIIYIKKIEIVDVANIKKFVRVLDDLVCAEFYSDPEVLPLVGLAKCSTSTSLHNKTIEWATCLTAKLSESFRLENRRIAIILSATNGEQYIIGGRTKPYPLVNSSASHPDKSSDPIEYLLTAEFSDSFGLTRVLR